MSSIRRAVKTDDEAWQAYRLYQRDMLLSCLEDAHHIARRMRPEDAEVDLSLLVSLLWDKRCQPWKFYRDEQRAAMMLR